MNQRFRTLLLLGRASNLPTVWSNCLAGWWLSGGGNLWKLPLVLLGASALYTGGMFLNDAFDVDFDRQRRASRPIPSGMITEEWVWIYGWGWLALGILLLIFCGKLAGALAVVLAVCIVIYDAAHKVVTASPWLMGLCRFWVYVIAGTVGRDGLNGWPIWCGVALAFYIVGLSYVARRESFRGPVPYWPLIFWWRRSVWPCSWIRMARGSRRFISPSCWWCGSSAVCERFSLAENSWWPESFLVCWRELFWRIGWPSRRNAPFGWASYSQFCLGGRWPASVLSRLLEHCVLTIFRLNSTG